MADNAFTGARGEPDLLMTKTTEKADDASSGDDVHQGGIRALSEAEEKILSKAYLKLDLFFLSTLTIIYWLNFLDRANIGNARAAGRKRPAPNCASPLIQYCTGLQTDLGLTNTEYSICLTVTYVSFLVAEWPSVMFCKKMRVCQGRRDSLMLNA